MTPSRVITSVRRTARAAAGILVDNFCPFWGLGCPKRGLKNGDTIVNEFVIPVLAYSTHSKFWVGF